MNYFKFSIVAGSKTLPNPADFDALHFFDAQIGQQYLLGLCTLFKYICAALSKRITARAVHS